jgi:hypothetical protein
MTCWSNSTFIDFDLVKRFCEMLKVALYFCTQKCAKYTIYNKFQMNSLVMWKFFSRAIKISGNSVEIFKGKQKQIHIWTGIFWNYYSCTYL